MKLDESLGALAIGTWANSMLITLEILQVLKYFRNYTDHWLLRLTVIVTLLVDILSTIGNYACVYMYTITHWGDQDYALNQYWPIPMYLATTGIVAAIVQCFLIWRYFVLTRNVYISPVLGLFMITALAGSLATAATIINHPTYVERDSARIPVTVWLVASSVADVAIALALIYQLNTVHTTFKQTKGLITRLTSSAIKTGTATTVVALLALILYLHNTENNVSVGIAFCLGRIYALTMLYNLNTRVVSSPKGSSSGSHTQNAETRREPHFDTYSMGGIHVHRTALVTMDDGESDLRSGYPAKLSALQVQRTTSRTSDEAKSIPDEKPSALENV